MSRYNPHFVSGPIYDAAKQWKERSLIGEQSVFLPYKKLWTSELLDELDQHVVKNPDYSGGSLDDRLKKQLSGGSSDCKQLMAECLWLLLLFPTEPGSKRTRPIVRKSWSWSGEELKANHYLLDDTILNGIGPTGLRYNQQRLHELVLLISALRDFRYQDDAVRQSIVLDPWRFSEWLSSFSEASGRHLIHILPHLLFPDKFERISTKRDKQKILARLDEIPEKESRKWSVVNIDRALLGLRLRLEKRYGSEIDFYTDEFLAQWKNSTKAWLVSWNPSEWNWDTRAADIAKIMAGKQADCRWRCKGSGPEEGDRIFLMQIETSPEGIVASGKVARAPYEDEDREQDDSDIGEAVRFIDVTCDSIRDASVGGIVELENLWKRGFEQKKHPQSLVMKIKGKDVRILENLWCALPSLSTPGNEPTPKPKTHLPLNLIMYGPPGTGKTHYLRKSYLPNYRDEDGDRFKFVTFHQSYAYEDFVEGIRPITKNGVIVYKVRDGVLKNLCDLARKAPDKRFALFIDEINRGNTAKIFGELITLIETDKRIRTDRSGNRLADCDGLEVTLPYSGDSFGVPINVDVIGTMNTADRSIALLDSALRRRFLFEELMPNPKLLESIDDDEGGTIDLRLLLETINTRISHLLHRDQTLGHSYFYYVKSFKELRRAFVKEILPFMQEAFYDDWRQIRYVLADQTVDGDLQLIREHTQSAASLFPRVDSSEVGDGKIFEVAREDEITPDAIRKIYELLEE